VWFCFLPGDDVVWITQQGEAAESAEGVRSMGFGIGLTGYSSLVRLA